MSAAAAGCAPWKRRASAMPETTADEQWPGQQLALQDDAAPEYGPAPQLLCDSQMHDEPSHAQPLQSAPLPPPPPLEGGELPFEVSTVAIAVGQSIWENCAR